MNMNILEQENLIKGAPDEVLIEEAQAPSGNLPQFLIVSELQRRKQMRDRFMAQEQQPEQTISEQIVAKSVPQGIGALQQQASSMPMQAPQMPPEMMAAQTAPMAPQPQMMAAGGGRMPYRRMAGGGIVPPNSLVEDAAKFNPQTMYDMDASQMGMANPTNMGIASVLPMAAGGVVRMDEGGRIQALKDMAYEHYYGDDDKFNYGTALLDAASVIPVAGALGLGTRAVYQVGKRLAPKLGKYLKSGALQQKLKSGISSLRRGVNPRTSPLTTREVIAQGPVAKGGLPPTARQYDPKRILGTTVAYEALLNTLRSSNKEEVSAENNNQPTTLTTDQAKNFFLKKNQGGIVKMQAGGTTPFVSMVDVKGILAEKFMKPPAWLDDVEGDFLSQEQAESLREYMGEPQEFDTTLFPEKLTFEEVVTDLENQNQETEKVIGAPDVPVLQTGKVTPSEVGVQEISSLSGLLKPNQDTELKTARERLTDLMGQEVEPYDPTELLLKSQERSDQRAISQALINFGAGIAKGDVASGLEKAGESVGSIKDRQEALEQELQVRRGEAQIQAQKDQITRDIGIAQADIGVIESDRDYQDKLIGRQIQYEGHLLDARTADNDALVKQFTAKLAANNFLQGQSEFNRTLAANLNEQEQLNYRAQLTTLNKAFEEVSAEIIRRNMYAPEEGQDAPSWPEIEKELEDARVRIFGQIVALQEKGTDWKLPEDLSNIGSGEIQLISTRRD